MSTPDDMSGDGTGVRMLLFVAEGEPNSRRAHENLIALCSEELADRYELRVIDVLEDFLTATEYSVMVTPTLIVKAPAPAVTILGDLRDTRRLRAALRLD